MAWMKNNKYKILLPGALVVTLLWLFVGVFRERECPGEIHVFLKHRPTFKVLFYAPRGCADRSDMPGREGFLTSVQEKEERAYVAFVEQGGGYKRSFFIPISF
jgi:hypothetical protein